jgi:hypothetical protein
MPSFDDLSSTFLADTFDLCLERKIVFDEDGDLVFLSDSQMIQVSSKVLGAMTKAFDYLAPDEDSFSAAKIILDPTEFEPMLLLTNICYHKSSLIPPMIGSSMLSSLVQTALRFDCTEAIMPWVKIWRDGMVSSLPTVEDLVELLSLSFVLDDSDGFAERARDLILTAKGPFPTQPGYHIPPSTTQSLRAMLPETVLCMSRPPCGEKTG